MLCQGLDVACFQLVGTRCSIHWNLDRGVKLRRMGLPFVLLFWLIIGLVLSSVGAFVLAGMTTLLTRGVKSGRRRVIVATAVFPFACFLWAGCVFVFQAIVNEGLLDRDLGIGDTWHAPLPNGYQIMMIDVTDQGWVYNPKTQGTGGGVGQQEDAVPGVRNLQVSGRYILGDIDSRSLEHLGQDTDYVDSYFLLDAQTARRTEFKNIEALRSQAQGLGIKVNLEPINSVYSKFRFSWFDVFAGLVFCIPPLIGFILVIRWVWRLRTHRSGELVSAPSLPFSPVHFDR